MKNWIKKISLLGLLPLLGLLFLNIASSAPIQQTQDDYVRYWDKDLWQESDLQPLQKDDKTPPAANPVNPVNSIDPVDSAGPVDSDSPTLIINPYEKEYKIEFIVNGKVEKQVNVKYNTDKTTVLSLAPTSQKEDFILSRDCSFEEVVTDSKCEGKYVPKDKDEELLDDEDPTSSDDNWNNGWDSGWNNGWDNGWNNGWDDDWDNSYWPEIRKATISFKDRDGTILFSEILEYGTEADKVKEIANKLQPSREKDPQYSYKFEWWTPEFQKVDSESITYTAKYTATENQYEVTFTYQDGAKRQSGMYPYRQIIDSIVPTDTYVEWRQFVWRSPELSDYVTKDIQYTAIYATIKNSDEVSSSEYQNTLKDSIWTSLGKHLITEDLGEWTWAGLFNDQVKKLIDYLIWAFVLVWIVMAFIGWYKIMVSNKPESTKEWVTLVVYGIIWIIIMVSARFIASKLVWDNGVITDSIDAENWLNGVNLAKHLYEDIMYPFIKVALYLVVWVLFFMMLAKVVTFVISTDDAVKKKAWWVILWTVIWILIIMWSKQIVESVMWKQEAVLNAGAQELIEIWNSTLQFESLPIISQIINWVMWLAMFVVLVLIIIQAYRMFAHPDDPKNRERLKKTLLYVIIWVLVIGSAYVISSVLVPNNIG